MTRIRIIFNSLKIHSISDIIYVITAKDSRSLSWAFVRFQEFYESSNENFRGNYFTMKEYKDWWSSECGSGNFTYVDIWKGYNISGHTIGSWESIFRKKEPKLRNEEEFLLQLLHSMLRKKNKTLDQIYLIGLVEESFDAKDDAYLHELSHALFNLNVIYRKKSLSLFKNLPSSEKKIAEVTSCKATCGYSKDVFIDETIAYKTSQDQAFRKLLKETLISQDIPFDEQIMSIKPEKKIVLITGFEPSNEYPENVSGKLAKSLDQNIIDSWKIKGIVLPLRFHEMKDAIEQAIEKYQPSMIIGTGVASIREIRLETIAKNLLDNPRIPYNDGQVFSNKIIQEGAPDTLEGTLDVNSIKFSLINEKIPVKISTDAGTYGCNQAFFHVLYYLKMQGMKIPAGFIHLPFQWNLAEVERAFRIILFSSLNMTSDITRSELKSQFSFLNFWRIRENYRDDLPVDELLKEILDIKLQWKKITYSDYPEIYEEFYDFIPSKYHDHDNDDIYWNRINEPLFEMLDISNWFSNRYINRLTLDDDELENFWAKFDAELKDKTRSKKGKTTHAIFMPMNEKGLRTGKLFIIRKKIDPNKPK